jgi:hypothetical protein
MFTLGGTLNSAATGTHALFTYLDCAASFTNGGAAVTRWTGINVRSATLHANVVAGYSLYVDAPTGATANYAAAFMGGNVGIGTAAPADQLSVAKSTGTSISITTAESAGTEGSPKNLDLVFRGYLNYASAKIRSWDQSGSSNGGWLTFWTSPSMVSADTTLERMRITETGYVGIGTTAPTQQLQVGGNSGVIALGDGLTANGTSKLKFTNSNSASNWQISTNDSIASALEFMPSTAGGGVTFTTPTVIMKTGVLGVNGGASIGASYYNTAPPSNGAIIQGNVGIGTTTMTGLLNVEAADSTWLVLSYSDTRAASKNSAVRFIDGSEQFMGQLTMTSDGAANNASTFHLAVVTVQVVA